jgi:hypothetical protein
MDRDWSVEVRFELNIIGRYDRNEKSEDTRSAKQVDPTHTPIHSKLGVRPASKSC